MPNGKNNTCENYSNILRPYFANGGDGRLWYYHQGQWRVETELQSETHASEFIRSVGGRPSKAMVAGLMFELTHVDTALPPSAPGINVGNGFLTCHAGGWHLMPHHPGQGQRYRLPFDYAPQASCPRWLRFLEEVQPNPDVRLHLQTFFGWVLLGHGRPHEERFSVWLGNGANGKSVAMGVLKALVGQENTASLSLHEFNGKNVELLANKLVNLGSETERSDKVETSILKKLVSGEPVLATPKYRHHYEVTCNTALVFAVNDVPAIDDRSDGIWRRLMLVNWPVTLAAHQRDKSLLSTLVADELAGILNWALDGATRVLQQGLFIPEGMNANSQQLRTDNNSVALFVDDAVKQSPHATIAKSDLYHAFRLWCTSRGYKVMSEVNFGKELRRLGLAIRDGKTRAGYIDIEGRSLNSRLNAYQGLMIPAERIYRDIQLDGNRSRVSGAIGIELSNDAANDDLAW